MKFSESTLAVLKNFASINSGVVLKSGNFQKTIAPEKSILVEAEISESLPYEFGIYDLNQFLGNISALDNPELSFDDKRVIMSDGDIELNYYSSSATNIISPPEKALKMTQVDVSFTITNSILQKLLRLSSMNNLIHLSVVGKNGDIRLQTHDKTSDTSNFASFKLSDYTGKDFIASFKVENIKLIPADYDVEIQLGAFAKFTSKSSNINYYIALESK